MIQGAELMTRSVNDRNGADDEENQHAIICASKRSINVEEATSSHSSGISLV